MYFTSTIFKFMYIVFKLPPINCVSVHQQTLFIEVCSKNSCPGKTGNLLGKESSMFDTSNICLILVKNSRIISYFLSNMLGGIVF